MPQAAAPFWRVAHEAALEPDNLPRVLAGMGFLRRLFTARRGEIQWWQPDYHRVRPALLRLRDCGAHAARGLQAGEWSADALAALDAEEVRARAAVAEVNRMMRDSEVLFMQAPKDRPFAMVLIDIGAGDGAWRSPDHAVRGDCLISLGALMWGERYGRAARRIARLCGIYALPPAPPPLELGAVLQAAAERRIG